MEGFDELRILCYLCWQEWGNYWLKFVFRLDQVIVEQILCWYWWLILTKLLLFAHLVRFSLLIWITYRSHVTLWNNHGKMTDWIYAIIRRSAANKFSRFCRPAKFICDFQSLIQFLPDPVSACLMSYLHHHYLPVLFLINKQCLEKLNMKLRKIPKKIFLEPIL